MCVALEDKRRQIVQNANKMSRPISISSGLNSCYINQGLYRHATSRERILIKVWQNSQIGICECDIAFFSVFFNPGKFQNRTLYH